MLKYIQHGGDKPNVSILKNINIFNSYGMEAYQNNDMEAYQNNDMEAYLNPVYGFFLCETFFFKTCFELTKYNYDKYLLFKLVKDTFVEIPGGFQPNKKIYKNITTFELGKYIGYIFLCHMYLSANIDALLYQKDRIKSYKKILQKETDSDKILKAVDLEEAVDVVNQITGSDFGHNVTNTKDLASLITNLINKINEHVSTYENYPLQFDKNMKDITKLVNNKTTELYDIIFHVLLAIVWWNSNDKIGILDYYKGLDETFKYFGAEYHGYIIEIPDNFVNEYFSTSELNINDVTEIKTIEYGIALAYTAKHLSGLTFQQQGYSNYNNTSFADCGESTVRNFIKTLIVNFNDISKPYNIDLLKKYGATENVIEFFSTFNTESLQSSTNKVKIFGGDYNARDAWALVASDISCVNYLRISPDGHKFEMDHGINPQTLSTHSDGYQDKLNVFILLKKLFRNINDWNDFVTIRNDYIKNDLISIEFNINENGLGKITIVIKTKLDNGHTTYTFIWNFLKGHYTYNENSGSEFNYKDKINSTRDDKILFLMDIIDKNIFECDTPYYEMNNIYSGWYLCIDLFNVRNYNVIKLINMNNEYDVLDIETIKLLFRYIVANIDNYTHAMINVNIEYIFKNGLVESSSSKKFFENMYRFKFDTNGVELENITDLFIFKNKQNIQYIIDNGNLKHIEYYDSYDKDFINNSVTSITLPMVIESIPNHVNNLTISYRNIIRKNSNNIPIINPLNLPKDLKSLKIINYLCDIKDYLNFTTQLHNLDTLEIIRNPVRDINQSQNIIDIDFIQNTNITRLVLSGKLNVNIKNIDKWDKIKHLELDIKTDYYSDKLDAINNIQSLETFICAPDQKIINKLENNKYIHNLTIRDIDNKYQDLSPLAKMESLKSLSINRLAIKDRDIKFNNLEELEFNNINSYTSNIDLKELYNLFNNLRQLKIKTASIKNFDFISKFTKLEYLQTPIYDAIYLKPLYNLKELIIDSTMDQDAKVINDMINNISTILSLEKLTINVVFDNIEPLMSLPKLNTLALKNINNEQVKLIGKSKSIKKIILEQATYENLKAIAEYNIDVEF